MRFSSTIFQAGLIAAVVAANSPLARAQLRIVSYNVAQLNGNVPHLQEVLAALMIDDKPGFAVPPAMFCFQEVQSTDVTPLSQRLNAAAAPYGITYTLGTFTVLGSENVSGGAQAMFYRSSVLSEDTSAHLDIFTGNNRYADRWRMRLVGYSSPEVFLHVYSMHLPAGDTTQGQQDRLNGATAIRNNADALPAGTHMIYIGDFNLYSNSEPAYQKFISPGNGQAVDAFGTGSWSGSGNAIKHTQSPCNTGCTLVGGGMDDRFDFQLYTNALNDFEGLSVMAVGFRYRTFGNDGLHYNQAINAGNNMYYPGDLARSNAIAAALFDASDHCPVVVDYQIPAIMSASLPTDFGRVIQGTPHTFNLLISNAAQVVLVAGADELDYSVVASGALSGTATGSVNALAPPAVVAISVDTSTVGPVRGTVQVTSTSQGAQNASQNLGSGGTIVRPSNASFSGVSDVDSTTLQVNVTANSGVQHAGVDIHNLGYDDDQALLDVDGVSPLTAPFGFVGGLQAGIGITPATLTFSFDTTGAAGGVHTANVTINVSDEDIPGAAGTTMALTIEVAVQTPQPNIDIDCDGDVDVDDAAALAGVLVGTDVDPCHVSRADTNGSGQADGGDVGPFVAAYLAP